MCLGETPMEAVAKLMDDADVLSKAGLYDFHPHSEVYRIISKKDLPGGPFFTKALYEVIEQTIRYQIAQRPEILNDPYQMTLIWRDTAQREFDQIPGQDADLDAEIQSELQKRGGPPKWSTTTRAQLAQHAKDSQKGKSFYCDNHGWGSHTTNDCRFKPKGKTPEPNLALTTAMGTDTHPLAKGINPNIKWQTKEASLQTDPEFPDAANQESPQQQPHHPDCPNCTEISGRSAAHNPNGCCTDHNASALVYFHSLHPTIAKAAMWVSPHHPGDAALIPEPPIVGGCHQATLQS